MSKMITNYVQLLRLLHFLGEMSVPKRVLFCMWLGESVVSRKLLVLNEYVFGTILKNINLSDNDIKEINKKLANFVSRLLVKWKECYYNTKFFEKKNQKWLDMTLILYHFTSTSDIGRPKKDFGDLCPKAQIKQVSTLMKQATCEQLMVATSSSLYKSGMRTASKIVATLNTDETAAQQIKKSLDTPVKLPVPFSPEEALALYVDVGHTKHTYQRTRLSAKERNADIYPNYHRLQKAKIMCYPDGLKVTDYSAEITLQNLVDHTVSRIINAHSQVVENHVLEENNNRSLTAIYKWGCDGSSGHATYRQKFQDGETSMVDQHLFTVCLVPLQVQLGSTILWKNTRPSSTRYCRPIKLICQKETSELITLETDNVISQIKSIKPTLTSSYTILHEFHLTMVDGKTFGVLAEASTQTCGICRAIPKDMNNLDLVKRYPVDSDLLKYDLSSLHAWIRFFECVLHLSYRLSIKKWQVRGTDKPEVEARKLKIQSELRKEMGILVDIPMAGSGNTNNGNTARRFFSQPDLVSRITGVSEALIYNFSVILRALTSGYEINIDAFSSFAMKSAEMFVQLYPWFYMPSSIHKILIHGAAIIKHVSLPIGMMSEEALEARNKDCRNIREHHSRKNNRTNTMEDVMHALLVSSDPLITSLSKMSTNSVKSIKFDKVVAGLLINFPHLNNDSEDSDSDSE